MRRGWLVAALLVVNLKTATPTETLWPGLVSSRDLGTLLPPWSYTGVIMKKKDLNFLGREGLSIQSLMTEAEFRNLVDAANKHMPD